MMVPRRELIVILDQATLLTVSSPVMEHVNFSVFLALALNVVVIGNESDRDGILCEERRCQKQRSAHK